MSILPFDSPIESVAMPKDQAISTKFDETHTVEIVQSIGAP